MRLRGRTILHNSQGYHNKLYVIDLYQQAENSANPDYYFVHTHWGGRNATSFITSLKGSFTSYTGAQNLIQEIVTDKTRTSKGYVVANDLSLPNLIKYFTDKGIPTKVLSNIASNKVSKPTKGFKDWSAEAEAKIKQLNKPILRKIRL